MSRSFSKEILKINIKILSIYLKKNIFGIVRILGIYMSFFCFCQNIWSKIPSLNDLRSILENGTLLPNSRKNPKGENYSFEAQQKYVPQGYPNLYQQQFVPSETTPSQGYQNSSSQQSSVLQWYPTQQQMGESNSSYGTPTGVLLLHQKQFEIHQRIQILISENPQDEPIEEFKKLMDSIPDPSLKYRIFTMPYKNSMGKYVSLLEMCITNNKNKIFSLMIHELLEINAQNPRFIFDVFSQKISGKTCFLQTIIENHRVEMLKTLLTEAFVTISSEEKKKTIAKLIYEDLFKIIISKEASLEPIKVFWDVLSNTKDGENILNEVFNLQPLLHITAAQYENIEGIYLLIHLGADLLELDSEGHNMFEYWGSKIQEKKRRRSVSMQSHFSDLVYDVLMTITEDLNSDQANTKELDSNQVTAANLLISAFRLLTKKDCGTLLEKLKDTDFIKCFIKTLPYLEDRIINEFTEKASPKKLIDFLYLLKNKDINTLFLKISDENFERFLKNILHLSSVKSSSINIDSFLTRIQDAKLLKRCINFLNLFIDSKGEDLFSYSSLSNQTFNLLITNWLHSAGSDKFSALYTMLKDFVETNNNSEKINIIWKNLQPSEKNQICMMQDPAGNTLLHLAILSRNRSVPIIMNFMNLKALIHLKNKEGLSPFQILQELFLNEEFDEKMYMTLMQKIEYLVKQNIRKELMRTGYRNEEERTQEIEKRWNQFKLKNFVN